MIGTIISKELKEYRRDGRIMGIGILIFFLILISLATGWSVNSDQQKQAAFAQEADQEVFLAQGEKNPHSAAHFGRMAYKSAPPLSVFDPGALPYLGQIIWLEGHIQDPAMFRPAEDSLDLRRLADLSVAGVLTFLLPLLIFLVGYGSFAAERERGTLRQIMSFGSGISLPYIGKLSAMGFVGFTTALIAIVVSILLAITMPAEHPTMDIIIRGIGLILGYGLYVVVFAAIALFVSARSKNATSSMLMLLSIWALSVVVVPRLAANLAERVYPAPDGAAFWQNYSDERAESRLDPESAEYKEVERIILSRAFEREIQADEIANLKYNTRGLRLEVSEYLGAQTFVKLYADLYKTYENQKMVRRVLSLVSPTILLQHFSSTISGTDVTAHRHFADAAEVQRNIIIGALNEDLILNDVGGTGPYVSDVEFWETIPDFSYTPPSLSLSLSGAAWDFILLMIWALIAIGVSWNTAKKQKIV